MNFKKFRFLLIFSSTLFILILVFAPSLGNAQGLVPACGEVVNASGQYLGYRCQLCDLAKLIQNIIKFLIVDIATPVAALSFAAAGIIYMTAGGNPGKISRAHSIFRKVAVGFIIMLAAWLIIDIVMKGLIADQKFGVWNKFECVEQLSPPGLPDQLAPPAGTPLPTPPSTPGGPTGAGTGPNALCLPGNIACSPEALQAIGYNLNQANAMSCIAVLESTGNASRDNPTGCSSGGPGTPNCACGTFQILMTNWAKPQNHQGNCSVSTSCKDAACNIQTAYLMSQAQKNAGQSIYTDWAYCKGCENHVAQKACVGAYDAGG